ncbi:hypothetical protein FRC10_010701 [Ceratobasidium sp. 414]|nr:hypothetical protein FRC10_010701 [Ceratobasidium sp. 414]
MNDGWFSLCVPMTDAQFGILTATFTIGGFAGSLGAGRFLNKGRKHAVMWHGGLLIIGSLLMSIANSLSVLVIGRLLIGLGCGIGICFVPIYLAEVSPPAIQGRIGVLNQLGIVIEEREALLESEVEAHVPDEAAEAGDHRPAINVPSLLASRDLYRPVALVLVAMLVQQASGINAVMYFSNDILSRVVPREVAAYTSLGITVLNAIMTFPAIFLVDAVSAMSSLSMSVNWSTNFLIGATFLPLRNFLAKLSFGYVTIYR